MEDNREQVQHLTNYLSRTQYSRYPFRKHHLEYENNYFQDLYLTHLCAVTRAGKKIFPAQTLFIQRLTAGCKAEYDMDTYMRQSGDITEESLEGFLAQLKEKQFQDTFLLDSLLLTYLGEADQDQEAFVAEVCAALGIPITEMEQLSQLCASILRVDLSGCLDWEISAPKNQEPLWLPYLPANLPPVWKNTPECLAAAASGLTDFDLGPLGQTEVVPAYDTFSIINRFYVPDAVYAGMQCVIFSGYSKAIFRNLWISMDKHLHFENVDTVEFVNCTFSGIGADLSHSSSIWFSKCSSITFRACRFEHFSGRVMYTTNCQNTLIENSIFTDCFIKYRRNGPDWREFGAIVFDRSTNFTQLTLSKNQFINCGGCNDLNYFVSSIISNCKAFVYDCRFEQCWHCFNLGLGDSIERDPENSLRCLFRHILKKSGNEVIDSADLEQG